MSALSPGAWCCARARAESETQALTKATMKTGVCSATEYASPAERTTHDSSTAGPSRMYE